MNLPHKPLPGRSRNLAQHRLPIGFGITSVPPRYPVSGKSSVQGNQGLSIWIPNVQSSMRKLVYNVFGNPRNHKSSHQPRICSVILRENTQFFHIVQISKKISAKSSKNKGISQSKSILNGTYFDGLFKTSKLF